MSLKTIRTIDKTRKVYATSDIHGDLQVLVILLRDCARVIRKKGKDIGHYFDTIDPDIDADKPDSFINTRLDKNNFTADFDEKDTDDYKWDLNYEWCGGDSIVVIVGDLIDMFRYSFNKDKLYYKDYINEDRKMQHEGIQLECKIIMFINAINKQAIKKNGEIIKMIGNHELFNFKINDNIINTNVEDFITPFQKCQKYYDNFDRADFFKIGNPGFKLFQKGGIYSLLIINDTIFVHGQLSALDILQHHFLNILLNNNNIDIMQNNSDHLQDRYLGYIFSATYDAIKKELYDDDEIPIIIKNIKSNFDDIADKFKHMFDHNNSKEFKEYIKALFNNFNKTFNDTIMIKSIKTYNNIYHKPKRLIIGHCPQTINTAAKIYKHRMKQNMNAKYNNIDIFSGKIYNDISSDSDSHYSGITFEKGEEYEICRVDTGSSITNIRFDIINDIEQYSIESELKKLLEQFIPQILLIHNDKSYVIKSKIRNALINHPIYMINKNIQSEFNTLTQEKSQNVEANNENKHNYYVRYNEDKILENIINNIIDNLNKDIMCKNQPTLKHNIDGPYDNPYYVYSHVVVNCSNRDILTKKYICEKYKDYIYNCTFTDTIIINNCISFDKMYNPDSEWLKKEIIYNFIKTSECLSKCNNDECLLSQFINAMYEYAKYYSYNNETIIYNNKTINSQESIAIVNTFLNIELNKHKLELRDDDDQIDDDIIDSASMEEEEEEEEDADADVDEDKDKKKDGQTPFEQKLITKYKELRKPHLAD